MENLTEYLNGAIERMVRQALKSSFRNPEESAFLLKHLPAQKKSAEKRRKAESEGTHIPPFLIASIAAQCNLFCKGCYARANRNCGDEAERRQLSDAEWERIFREASQLGISFILLAGGEPLLRGNVLRSAARFPDILFPVFTNGTMFKEDTLGFFHKNRNLIPVLSVEGDEEQTDARRGKGVHAMLEKAMEQMNARGILYGASITVTTRNLAGATDSGFISRLYQSGCRFAIFVEYVPVEESTESLALSGEDRERLAERQERLRKEFENMIFISFPGDEKAIGGCLAAGRGFFHISAAGAAEPCPFSPFSDTSLKIHSLSEAMRSPFFQKLRVEGSLQGEHRGGCTLFRIRGKVEKMV